MYLFGNFIGLESNLIINAETKETEILKFLKENPKLKAYITDEKKVIAQYKLMGIELPKVEIKTKKSGSKKR
jgi:hypothetical protein